MVGKSNKLIVEAKAKNMINNDVRSSIGKEEKVDKASEIMKMDDIKIYDDELSLKRLLEFLESNLENELSLFGVMLIVSMKKPK